jgi:tryptophan synthase alpha chain
LSGVETIAAAFAVAREERRAALMPYLMGGFPDLDASRRVGEAYAAAGADLVELGVPYSDPLADGGVIHDAGTRALAAGARLDDVVAIGGELARSVPVVLMCYSNLVLARGIERFCDGLAEAGISGLIVPDLPLEEATEVFEACEERGLALVPLVAPTTPGDRLTAIAARARGFIYLVSVRGTTGERASVDAGLGALVARTRAAADGGAGGIPVAVGFGIGTPEQAAAAAAAGADGVIIGTRFVRAVGEGEDMAGLVGGFAAALQG